MNVFTLINDDDEDAAFHYGKDLASIKDISDARRKVEIRLVILIFLSTALPNFDGLIN